MSRATLTLLKAGFLLALYLFLFRAIRAVYLELSPKRMGPPPGAPPPQPPPVAAPAPPPVRGAKAHRSTQRIGSSRKVPTTIAILGGDGRTWPLQGDMVIGRASTSTIPIDDSYASSNHARLRLLDGGWTVEDLGSTNGTLVNGERISRPTPLRRGDRVQAGQTVLELRG